MFSSPLALVNSARHAEAVVVKSLSSVSNISCMKEFVNMLDDVSNLLCRVVDTSDCLRQLHPNAKWQNAAMHSFMRINSLMQSLNSNSALLTTFSGLNKHRPKFDYETEAVIESFDNDFRQLSEADEELQAALEDASMRYESNPTFAGLERLLRLRFEQARSLGKSSPAEVILRRRHFNTSNSVLDFLNGLDCKPTPPEPKIHFTLDEAFKLLAQVCKKTFGVNVEIQKEFMFCGLSTDKLSVFEDDELLGEVLVSRGAFPAHYTLQSRILGEQSAIVLITVPVSNASSSSRLSFRESQSLFHEFGHATHSVLSETRYQTLSGTRGCLEIAEIPSNIFELLHAQVCESEFEGIDRRDVELAVFDAMLHSTQPGKDGWSRALWPESLPKTPVPHLASYGASYYVYPLGKFMANKLMCKGSEFFHEKLFKRGGLAKLSDIY